MLNRMTKTVLMTLLAMTLVAPAAMSQQQNMVPVERDDDYTDAGYEYGDQARVDRYLGVEIWPNHHDGEYYVGDEIVLNFRTNRDAFVAIYTIDSRGRVNLLFPSNPNGENFIQGGVTHRLPGSRDDYDLVVSGPEGIENIQIIASREPFPIPDWYPVSGVVLEGDDRMAFMDYLNDRFFVRYGGQRFAYDRTAVYVNEWEDYYFAPVYQPVYHPWTLAGNVYIDYPFGSSVYINGIYWGCAPLYLPRVYVGWHTITIYDRWGYCWESDFHVSRYNTVVLDVDVIRTSPHVKSKYREVQIAGYRDPVKHGYPNFVSKRNAIVSSKAVVTKDVALTRPSGERVIEKVAIAPKKHLQGTGKLVKTERGIETAGIVPDRDSFRASDRTRGSYGGSVDKSRGYDPSSGYTGQSGKRDVSSGRDSYDATRGSKTSRGAVEADRGKSDYYQRKSGDRSRSFDPGDRQETKQGSKIDASKVRPRSGNATNPQIQPKAPAQKAPASKAPAQVKPSNNSGKGSSKSAVQSKSSSGSSGKSSGGSSKSDGKGKGR